MAIDAAKLKGRGNRLGLPPTDTNPQLREPAPAPAPVPTPEKPKAEPAPTPAAEPAAAEAVPPARPKKKAEPAKPEPTTRITVDLPASLHRRVKIDCAEKGETIADRARRLLEKSLRG